jgi:hypothetical protein
MRVPPRALDADPSSPVRVGAPPGQGVVELGEAVARIADDRVPARPVRTGSTTTW